ncbi:MAG TPA: hypothetical protein VFY93_04125 [Planctomycetota bacterium]|nr:hypothetical protein [Planctomycetota bacterium]
MRRFVLLALVAVVQAQDPKVDAAVADIAAGRRVAAAREVLARADRAHATKRLQAAIEDEANGIVSRARLLAALAQLDPGAPQRALASDSVAIRRAACACLFTDPGQKTACAEIALAWLKDPTAEDRDAAARICGRLEIPEGQLALLDIVSHVPGTEEEWSLFWQAIEAIKGPKPKEVVDRLVALALDSATDSDARGRAFQLLLEAKQGPQGQLMNVAIGILSDRNADRILRMRAALGLREFPEDRACKALEEVLLSDEEEDRILQRNCLFALGNMTPADEAVARRRLDRLRQLLVDRRVHDNPYFAIKVDVATALSALNARDPATLDIMCKYLLDEDKDDKEHLVRQEAWLTLWILTETKLAAPFDKPPKPFDDPLAARDFLFRRANHRPGVTLDQAALVARLAADLEKMRTTQQVYRERRAEILEQWRKDAAAKQEKAAEAPPKPPELPPEER